MNHIQTDYECGVTPLDMPPLSEGEKVLQMIDTYTRKKLKMKKHKRVKRRKLLKNLLKQSGKI